MTRPNGNAINASVRKNVDRYEAMLVSGRREYFDEDDLLDVADYYYNDMSRKENALQCIEYALSLHPECLMALLMKAEIYFYSGKRDEAWLIIDSVSDRTDQDVLYYKGLFLKKVNLKRLTSFIKKRILLKWAIVQNCFVRLFRIIWSTMLRTVWTNGLTFSPSR